jgi:predicted DNA binding protein
MRWANFLLKIPDNWMTWLLQEHDIHIKVFNCMPYEREGGRGLIRLSSNENMDAIIDLIQSRCEVIRACFSYASDRTIVGEVVIDKCAACLALKQSECFMVSSKSAVGGWLEWTVAAQNNSAIHDLIDRLMRNKCDVQLTRISNFSGGSNLTQRQDEILQYAYSNGYYEYPRRIRLRDLSLIFEVSPSTMSEILRAGHRRIFSEYFVNPPKLGV